MNGEGLPGPRRSFPRPDQVRVAARAPRLQLALGSAELLHWIDATAVFCMQITGTTSAVLEHLGGRVLVVRDVLSEVELIAERPMHAAGPTDWVPEPDHWNLVTATALAAVAADGAARALEPYVVELDADSEGIAEFRRLRAELRSFVPATEPPPDGDLRKDRGECMTVIAAERMGQLSGHAFVSNDWRARKLAQNHGLVPLTFSRVLRAMVSSDVLTCGEAWALDQAAQQVARLRSLDRPENPAWFTQR